MRGDADEDVERVALGEDLDRVEAERLADEGGRADAAVGGEAVELGVDGLGSWRDDAELDLLVVDYSVGSIASTSSPHPASTMRRRAALSTCPSRP